MSPSAQPSSLSVASVALMALVTLAQPAPAAVGPTEPGNGQLPPAASLAAPGWTLMAPLLDVPGETDVLGRSTLVQEPTARLAGTIVAVPRISGLGWASGSSCHSTAWESYRGRRNDIYNIFLPRSSFPAMVTAANQGWVQNYGNLAGRTAISTPLLTDDTRGQFARCAQGAFDSYFRQLGQAFARGGLRDAVVRLGWEASGQSFPWAILTASNIPNYKSCFRRAAQAIKAAAPGVTIDWPMAKASKGGYNVTLAWPGDDIVDVVSVSYYDGWPIAHTDAEFASQSTATVYGGPKGILAWWNFARQHGKKLGTLEWGISGANRADSGGYDNPVFIRGMYKFFKGHASTMAYELYFNCRTTNPYYHLLYPTSYNPLSSAQYRQLWSSGQ